MSTHAFYIVDVFAEEKYAGNQLAVVLRAQDLGAPRDLRRAWTGERFSAGMETISR